MNIGVVTFGMPPVYNRKVEIRKGVDSLIAILADTGFGFCEQHIVNPVDLDIAISFFKSENIDCLIFNMRHWGRNSLMVQLARRMDVPLVFYCHTQNGMSGVTITTSASGVLREMDYSRNINTHERFTDLMTDKLLNWIKAVDIRNRLRRSRVMCWGGSYGADMPYTRSDADALENLFISEVMVEPEKTLTDMAANIARNQPERIESFLNWYQGNGGKIEQDGKMITPKSLWMQVSLYLAARDRLADLSDENIVGVSIKCHFELSICDWGCTACTLPAFLPFGEDSEGPKHIVPTACEGDLNGLIGLLVLHALNPNVPPLFGDFVEYRSDYVQLRNCGASSVFWAGLSDKAEKNLKNVTLKPNIHGASGAAVSYETPSVETVTVLRIFRLRGEICAIYGAGEILGESTTSQYSDPWPHTRLFLGVDNDLFFKVVPCNHASLTLGDHTSILQTFFRLTGIKVYRCDSNEELMKFESDILG